MDNNPNNAPPTVSSYNLVMRVLHALMLFMVLLMFYLGVTLAETALADPNKAQLLVWHVMLGLLLLFLAVPRLFISGLSEKPQISGSMRFVKLAKLSHHSLYIMMISVPITGYFLLTETDISLNQLFFANELTTLNLAYQESIFAEVHESAAWIFCGLIVIHFLAALKHQFIDKDGSLRKIFRG